MSAKNSNQAIKVDKIKEIIEIIKNISENERDIERSNVSLRIEIKNKTENLNRIIEKIGSLNVEKEIFDFKWSREISSGEKALIILFSRVYDTINKLDKDKSYVILLDEPDIYMHPEWQRNLLQELINFVKYYFEDQKVQIILTSHSPFVISDLPRENVIFLDKDDDGKCKVVESSEKKKTFGANIHTLLSDGFFMESTLGEFARSKISWVMEILDKNIEEIRKEEEKIRTIINMIGEPIIKNKLMKMLEDKLKLNLIGVDERIRRLEEEIKALKEIKGE
jgi:predicted ATP-binding protein involved in virulence